MVFFLNEYYFGEQLIPEKKEKENTFKNNRFVIKNEREKILATVSLITVNYQKMNISSKSIERQQNRINFQSSGK